MMPPPSGADGMPSSTDRLFNRILLVAVIIGAVVITAVTVFEDDRKERFAAIDYESKQTMQPIGWGLSPAQKDFGFSEDNLFILKDKYEIEKGIYVLNLRVAGRYQSRVYTGMVRLIAEPYSRDLFMQVGDNNFKIIPYDSYAHKQLGSLFYGIPGEQIRMGNRYLEDIGDTLSDDRIRTLVSNHSP